MIPIFFYAYAIVILVVTYVTSGYGYLPITTRFMDHLQ
jgi:hypothetical protein